MNKIKKLWLVGVLIILTAGFSNTVGAEGLPFSVEPILPSNQDVETSSYISVSPEGDSHKQDFEFKLTNTTDEEQEVVVTVLDAYTSSNGVIQYVTDESENSMLTDESYKLSEYLTVEDEVVTLKKGETKNVTTSLDVDDHDGTLLGAVSFGVIKDGEQQDTDGTGFQINNQINMVIGVLVNFQTEEEVTFDIGDPFLDPMPAYYVVRLPVTLDTPHLQSGTTINYEVLHKDSSLFEGEFGVSFAPKTKTNLSIPYEHDEIEEGETYQIKGTLTYEDGNEEQVIEFDKNFKYTKEEKKMNEAKLLSVPTEVSDFPLVTLIFIGVAIVILLTAYFILDKKDKEKKKLEEVNKEENKESNQDQKEG